MAVTVALWLAEKAPAVAVKVAVLLPCGMLTDVGTVTLLELDVSVTRLAAAVGALRATVQVDVPFGPTEAGLQTKVLIATEAAWAAAIWPPALEMVTEEPAEEAPKALLMPMDAAVAPGFKVAATTATTPFGIAFELRPQTKQE